MRVGIGYDSHRFTSDRPLVLGGVRVPHTAGLAGHSDADVLLHAIADALLGAAGLGDLGRHFPDTDAQWKNADSRDILQAVVGLIQEHGYQVGAIDSTVICETPRLEPYIDQLRRSIAGAAGISREQVSVKGKSNEGLGWIGRREGIACLAVATLLPTASGPQTTR